MPTLDTLRRVFGYDAFRGNQQDIIDHVVGGGDALVLMPTGGGKSLCYQIPALVRPGVGIVVSPLIALMQDQVDALTALGVRAGFLNSTQDFAQRQRGRGGVPVRRPRPALPRAGAVEGRVDAAVAGPGHDLAVRHRRGALCRPVGPRLPARLPGAVAAARALAVGAAHRADRDRHRRDPQGDRAPAEPGGGAAFRRELRPAQHPVPDRREEPAGAAAAGAAAHRARRRRGHRLLPVAGVGRAHRAVPGAERHPGAALPRGARLAHPRDQPGEVPARGRHGHRRDHRVRHGHRQAGRAVRRAPGPAEVRGGLLPGDGPGRAATGSRRRRGSRTGCRTWCSSGR